MTIMPNKNETINVGIGFVTGRKSFKKVFLTYVENWRVSGLVDNNNLNLNIFVAYDLNYKNTRPSDYINSDQRINNMVDQPLYIGDHAIKSEIDKLTENGVLNYREADLLFGEGYAKKRNVIMYFAVKNKMDYLLFLDDDEYPMAALKQEDSLVWKGQQVLQSHLELIKNADITHGYHCGYVSPIPNIEFNDILKEEDFRVFIETISNDILSWRSIKEKMKDGGITYADPNIFNSKLIKVVKEKNNAKFISGSNLCINLKNKEKVYPFFNPPGARGEDTFLSTCLKNHRVLKVPCYTFHDGFASYEHLLCGTLPDRLKPICGGSVSIDKRFYKACIGWIRYKPLLLYITKRDSYKKELDYMKKNLHMILPVICRYFNNDKFMRLEDELEKYSSNVEKHFEMFEETKNAWRKLMVYFDTAHEKDFLMSSEKINL